MITREGKELLQKMFTSKTKFAKQYGLSRDTLKNAEFGRSPIPEKISNAITSYIDELHELNVNYNYIIGNNKKV